MPRGVKLIETVKKEIFFYLGQVVNISDIITEGIEFKASQGQKIPYLFKVERDANTPEREKPKTKSLL